MPSDLQAPNEETLLTKKPKGRPKKTKSLDGRTPSSRQLSLLPQLDGPSESTFTPDPPPHALGRKRRKLEHDQTARSETHYEKQEETQELSSTTIRKNVASDMTSADDAPPRQHHRAQIKDRTPQKPAKTLRLNGKGTLNSPESIKDQSSTLVKSPSGNKIRRRRSPQSQFIISIHYGGNDAAQRQRIGSRIEKLLRSDTIIVEDSAPTPSTAINTARITHPFFLGKTTAQEPESYSKQAEQSQEKEGQKCEPPKTFTTPVKFKAAAVATKTEDDDAPFLYPQARRRDLNYSAWPWAGFSATLKPQIRTIIPPMSSRGHCLTGRSQKRKRVEVDEENLVLLLNQGRKRQKTSENEYSMRENDMPSRSLETFESLKANAAKVSRSLDHLHNQSSMSMSSNTYMHPAVGAVFDRIGNHMTAFDRGTCENQSWLQVYAPQRVADILQPENETSVIRKWLAGLTTDAIENRLRTQATSRSTSQDRHLKRKKRRKRQPDDLNDFLVTSDEEENELQRLDDDDIAGSLSQQTVESDSLIRPGDANPKGPSPRCIMNTILLSGPNGCGKTAAAYAVAQELGFSVFEINASSRRSGRDILDKVGDMSLNHQVKKADSEPGDQIVALPQQAAADQNTLGSFFSAQAKSKGVKKAKSNSKAKAAELVKSVQKTSKHQKQSLILIEEVDVLFDDDKQFWETVTELAKQSRRPIVMTCNDERTLPLSSLSLHAILRFKPPREEVAAQYLCTIAAAEGHIVDVGDAAKLYKSTGSDLRASIAHLDFSCQMAVGSDKGGLDWYLKRWPAGSDLNAYGQQLRVVSNGTFRAETSILGADSNKQCLEELAQDAWIQCGIEPATLAFDGLTDIARHQESLAPPPTPETRYQSLKTYSSCIDQLCAADLFQRIDHPTSSSTLTTTRLDPSLPPISENIRPSFTQDACLLLDERILDFEQLGVQISTSLHIGSMRSSRSICGEHLDASAYADELLTKGTSKTDYSQSFIPNPTDYTWAFDPLVDNIIDLRKPRPALTTDIASYTRSIVRYDIHLEEQRASLFEVTGGKATKARKTRASRSALEGGQRSNTRRERWFDQDVDYEAVLATGGPGWPDLEAELLNLRQDLTREEDTSGEE